MSNEICQLLAAIHAEVVRIADANCASIPVASAHQAYTRTQAARLLGVSTWTIDRARKQGALIEARRIGERDVRITGESLMEFVKESEANSVRVRKM